ncbi:hypothetical protein TIFTF001_038844 [Ficus carica]|uniref:E2 ubiquitin-conjugating enzyme n=1 Tax=Ficus carica TaxID=3494 RepID=A0AA88E8S5_FICCA|nr:hypothetical protein TIFTF001_038836 [Ficus carica]GMN69795.1 hypothetical protein TIFTF001_038838 [Ficus carica]GMN69796.1 hypothetical protein TIFTF001_038842 [Ficus carica]GMN69801.1 hypothetical protein TIFTF001_038844 [Ficus carica]
MAQAARLNLRMQKELKLLLADPPPGASFPGLSSDSPDLSLSFLDAQIKGPEGTVYADGVFNVKIQIPERYPFQPPIVTFATPIYHPNIDNGGRICLDILNLPPKGAWQPSLNISTVLTSIGLLLSEPNPDDGLMCEASREYKYNRQAFDQKARSMTEKYAHPGASGNVGTIGCTQTVSSSSMVEVKTSENESKPEANESILNCRNIYGTSRKLTLESSGPSQRRVGHGEGNETSGNNLSAKDSENPMEVEATKKESKDTIQDSIRRQEKLNGKRRKLSLMSFAQSQKLNDTEDEDLVSKNISSCTENLSLASSGSADRQQEEINQCQDRISKDAITNTELKKPHGFCQKQPIGYSEIPDVSKEKMLVTPQLLPSETHTSKSDEPQPQKNCVHRIEKASSGTSHKKLSLVRKMLSLGSRDPSGTHNKENVELPVYKRPRSSVALSSPGTELSGKDEDYESGHGEVEKQARDQKQSLSPLTRLQESDSNQIQPLVQSESLFSSSKSMSKQQDIGWGKHQCFDQGQSDKTYGMTKQKKAEESLVYDAVIVLDSEDSDEEKSMPSRSKPVPARKRLGKWPKVRA